jgi:pimeloyl-ACP methyl ester carboxylesterase
MGGERATVRLGDGRTLAYRVFGDPAGVPVFGFHGTPGSADQYAIGAIPPGIRVLALDRPGYGGSTFQRGRKLVDFPRDVAAVADALRLERFGVVGVSGGGPHSLVCAHTLGARLLGACCVSGVAPLAWPGVVEGAMPSNQTIFRMSQRPRMLRLLLGSMILLMRIAPSVFKRRAQRDLPEPDRRIAADPAVERALFGVEAMGPRAGRAAAQDFEIFGGDWGFRLEDIRVPVHLWQGDQDRNVPPQHVQLLAKRIPRAIVHECPGEGHLLVVPRSAEILTIAAGKA